MNRHDHLASALDLLLEQLERGDALAAATTTQSALELFAGTPSPGGDERLRSKYERCQLAMNALYARLERELRETANSSRAGKAYGVTSGSEP